MKSSLFLLASILLVIAMPTFATEVANGKISGTVVDAITGQPVEFATVALNDPQTNKPVDGTVCDDKGKFVINKVGFGNYKLVISFIGYETYSQDVAFTDRKNSIELGTIKLGASVTELNEVVVQGQRQLVEEKVDRTVYNAENDKTTAGGDAADVLRRVPMLSVDLDGNVSMRGNSNIRVLINNKPSTIAASSVADALKQIPADQIKSVEVITSPSAKYDAEGSAGIINIITKKSTMQGATLGIDAGVGLRGSNLGLNGNLRFKKMGFSLGGWGRAGYNVIGAFSSDQLTTDLNDLADPNDDVTSLNIQSADTRRNDLMGRYNLGWDFDINKYNSITASVRYGVRNASNYQDGLSTQRFENNALVSSSLRDARTKDNSGNVDVNLDYTRLFEKAGKEFSILTQYSRNDRTNDFQNLILNESTEDIISRIKNENASLNEEITLQADYQTPIGSNQIVETGGKQIIRKVTSDFQYFTALGNDPYAPSSNVSLANIFNYNQDVTAGYLSYTLNSKSGYSFKAGSRYEYTKINANFQNATEINTNIPSYGAIVPSVNVSKKLKGGKTIKLAYNRRLQRPSIQYLNPNIQASNPLNVTIGNPNLAPEFTDNFELTYSTFVKGTSLNFSSFVRKTSSAIQAVREVRGDTVYTNYQNIGQEDAYGLSIFTNATVGKFSINGGGDFYYAVLNNNVSDPIYGASNEGFVYNGRLFGSYNMKKGWGLQFFSTVWG
jgi:outer membrane receptor protein involved in Fe transport